MELKNGKINVNSEVKKSYLLLHSRNTTLSQIKRIHVYLTLLQIPSHATENYIKNNVTALF